MIALAGPAQRLLPPFVLLGALGRKGRGRWAERSSRTRVLGWTRALAINRLHAHDAVPVRAAEALGCIKANGGVKRYAAADQQERPRSSTAG